MSSVKDVPLPYESKWRTENYLKFLNTEKKGKFVLSRVNLLKPSLVNKQYMILTKLFKHWFSYVKQSVSNRSAVFEYGSLQPVHFVHGIVNLFFFRMHFELRILLRRLPRKYGKDVARSWANTLGAALRVPGSIKFLGHLPSSCYTQYSSL